MRLFIALNLPAEERARIHAAAAPLRAAGLPVRWVEPESIHLTLKFLGEVARARLAEIRAALAQAAAAAAPLRLDVEGIGAFPNPRRARVVWAGIRLTPGLAALQEAVETRLVPLGFAREGRPFQPHLTLGRSRPPGGVTGAESLMRGIELRNAFTASTLDLMESTLSPRGARYERIAAAPLGATAEERQP